MANQKEAIAILLDVGPSMNQAPPGGTTALKTAIACIQMILQRKMFSESKDEIALILFGTANTANDLADGESYENVSLACPLGPVSFEVMKYVENNIQPSNVSADFLDAMVVGMDHIVKSIEGKKGYGTKHLILLSDLGGEFGDDQLADIVASMRENEVDLTVIGPDIDFDDADEGGIKKVPVLNGHSKEKTAQQEAGEALLKNIIIDVNGACHSFAEAIPALSFFQSRQVRGTAWKCTLDIGADLKIPVAGYIKVKEAKAKSYKTVYAKDPETAVQTERTFHLNNEEETEIEKGDCVTGHRYGNTLVPFLEDDLENMKFQSVKGFKVLGFTNSENVKRHHYMGDNTMSFVSEKGDLAAAMALSAFIKAMYETDTVAIVRRVYQARSTPKLGFLSPQIKADYECMYYNELPFAEDIRQFTFGSLPMTDDNEVANKKMKPTDQQLSAVDKLIMEMDLTKASIDEDGEAVEVLKPKLTFNPHLQRLFQCLEHRALNPDDPLPELSPLVAAYLKPPQELITKCEPIVDEMKKIFKLEWVAKEKAGDKKVFKDGDDEGPAVKKAKLDDDLKGGMANLSKVKVTEVGTLTPVEDFRTLATDDGAKQFDEACKMMQRRVLQLVTDSFGSQFYDKAMDCLKVLRQETLKGNKPELFNDFIKEVKELTAGKDRDAFWKQIVSEKQGLLTSVDCSISKVTTVEADDFFNTTSVSKVEAAKESQGDDADDLLDEMA